MFTVPSLDHGLPWTKQANKAVSLEEHQSVDSLKAAEKQTLRTDSPCRAQQLNGSNTPDKSWKFQFLQLLIPTTCNEEPGKEWFKHPISEYICRSNHIASRSVIQILTKCQIILRVWNKRHYHCNDITYRSVVTGRATQNQGLLSLIVIFKVYS